MPLLVRPCHHHRFRAALADAFRLGREAVEEDDDGLDGDAAFLLIGFDAARRVVGVVRATPGGLGGSVRDRHAGHADAAIPRGRHVVELSHLCAAQSLSGRERIQTLLELRAGLALLSLRQGWTCGIVIGPARRIQPFILSGMTLQALGPPTLAPGDSQPSFAMLARDPGLAAWAVEPAAGRSPCLLDPDEDPSLFTRYGDRAVA